MYEPGQHVICRDGGVWLITEQSGDRLHLVEHERGATRELPADGEDIVRSVASREKILEVIDRVAFIPAIQAPGDRARNELYEASMAMFDEVEWIRVIKSVYLRGQDKRLPDSEIAHSEAAKRFLYGEISVLLEIPLDRVEEHITRAVTDDSW